jgi:hypothetical protein
MPESRIPGRYLAPALVACAVAATTATPAAELTIDRLFDAAALSGPTIIGLKVSPDGSRVTYLQGKTEDKDRRIGISNDPSGPRLPTTKPFCCV